MTDIPSMVDLITRGGLLSALIIALIGGMRGWYVWGRTYEQALKEKDEIIADKNTAIASLEKDRNYWRDITLRLLTANEKTLQVSEKTLSQIIDSGAGRQG